MIDAAGIVRCPCREGGWGIATFNNRDDLRARGEQAYQLLPDMKVVAKA